MKKGLMLILFTLLTNLFSSELVSKKNTVLLFTVDGCPYCHRMTAIDFKTKEISKYMKENFIYKEINVTKVGKKLAKKYKVMAYPSGVLLDENGKKVYKFLGYKTQDEFLAILKYIHTDSYKKMKFSTFEENLEFENDN